MRLPVLPALCLFALAGCRPASSGLRAGEMTVEWLGPQSQGRVGIPARARFCRETRVVELLALRGDTGLGLALFPVDSARLAPGEYPVFHAGMVEEPRPGANLALRWFDQARLEAFEGLDGTVRIAAGGEQVSGTFEARLRSVDTSDTLQLTGRFERVPLTVSPLGCAATLGRNRI